MESGEEGFKRKESYFLIDVLVFGAIGLAMYILMRVMLKEPIIPWKEKKVKVNDISLNKQPDQKSNKKKKGTPSTLDEEEAAPFRTLFPDIVGFENHMVRRVNNEFSMMAEVEPVNYYLRDHDEQEIIDGAFETWIASNRYDVRVYIQNRYVDLSEAIEEIQKTLKSQDNLNHDAREFGENMVRDLLYWQNSEPRFEAKRFIIFDYRVDVKEIKADDKEELEEKIIDKAFNELHRRIQAAKQHLRTGEMEVNMLSTDGIVEVCYYAFNRKRALKNRYKDVEKQEQLSLYVTADQTPQRIALVKGELEKYVQNEKESSGSQTSQEEHLQSV
ncbi:hypothetical protein [Lysinibacillus sp. OL1]|uniref:hypothetical protein n=1 Tax=Lysinibacillus sp. OL1 TaxID=2517243 RepID=UPI00103B050F|nr:hypothetical protein [Lysinibacillus sp. OL1]TBV85431.1 hypothetical protein EW028_20990 [Lysinibacillus sp. OL1]